MQVKIFCNNAGVNQTPGWRTCIEIDAVSLKQFSLTLDPNSYLSHQLGVMAGSEVALSQMSLKEGGEGGLIVNTASLAGVIKNMTNCEHKMNVRFVLRLCTG